MPGETLLSHCQALRDDPEFQRWDTSDYIPISAVEAPAGLPWGVVLSQADDAPPAEDAVAAAHAALSQDDHRLLAILGPPFSGQTSAMRRLAWQLAERPARGAPIFVDLARYAAQPAGGRRLCRTIAEAAGAYVPALAPAMDDLLSQSTSRGGPALIGARIVFILDGLEGVQRQLRDGLASELRDLLGDPHMAAHRFVLSCRYEDLPPALSARARLLLLKYLSGREVLRYLRARRGSSAQANARFGQILDAQLLDLAALPPLLADILQRFEDRHSGALTRNQLLQDSLESQIAGLPANFQRGDVARQSLIALAWTISWQPDEALDINQVFAILGAIRRERSYSLEDLYDQLCAAGMLHDVDRRRATFRRPGQRAYCAALALLQRADLGEALADLLPQCAVVDRQARWEAVLIDMSGMLSDHTPLQRIVQAARSTNNGLYMVMLARCIQALPRGMFEQLAPRERGALLDACAAWADPAREPSGLRRAQIAEALGCLPDATSVRALLRLACERIRPAISRRLDYEYTSVRLSAALGLRNLMLFRPPTHPAGAALWQNVAPETKAALLAWVAAGEGAEASLRMAIQAPSTPLEARIIALIALADLAADGHDMLFLMRQITAPPPPGRPDDGEALIRTAADALTLCDARRVAALIGHLLRHPPPLSDAAIGQLIYLAGRVRAHDPGSLRWLAGQLADHPDPLIKAKALRSLAWIVGGAPPMALDGTPLGPALLAVARQVGRGQLIDLALPPPLSGLSLAGCAADDPCVVYLRRTALECLRWLPGDAAFAELAAEAEAWPIDLRRALSRSAALRDGGAK
ncbi:hypothetical protein K2Z83_24040 [Oscillochloris sp. ZM17-4]|uniref:hypothetical protein n=1 Tax=Oscillochloris sp. ZM17-4 TaxID=2866714 RepID=UPI001C73A4E0|nr:hypothetical protein [Oscillochloris sp. ZM17-4]MBX0330733.1 hypothetical protein [Oscillochloris sp. ZM17-4]